MYANITGALLTNRRLCWSARLSLLDREQQEWTVSAAVRGDRYFFFIFFFSCFYSFVPMSRDKTTELRTEDLENV